MAVTDDIAGPSEEQETSTARPVVRRRPLWRRLLESRVGVVGAIICLFWLMVAVLAPWLAPFNPYENLVALAPPGTAAPDGGVFWLGTDLLGRDILSRLVHGTRTVLIWASLATLSSYAVGVTMGVLSGYYGGKADLVLSFIANVILSFPVLVLYVIIISTVGASGTNIILAVTFTTAPAIFRIVRALVLDLRTRDYVAAAVTRGEPDWYIMLIEILPNARAPLVVDVCLRFGYTAITIGVLGFLGLGLPPPTPDWGGMINEGRSMAMAFPHLIIFPCIAISSLVLGMNLLADGLREVSLKD